jgi:hypothetical protein
LALSGIATVTLLVVTVWGSVVTDRLCRSKPHGSPARTEAV